MSGRTSWHAKDSEWWAREWIVVLGEEFGSAGPSVIDWLECKAKAQNDGGHVKSGVRSIARGVFADVVTVGHVLSRAVTLGLLVDFEDDNGLFTARISWWQADQERALAATRKARQRAEASIDPEDPAPLSRSVTPSHGESQNVPLQDRTGGKSSNEDLRAETGSKPSSTETSAAKASQDDRDLCTLLRERCKARNPKFKVKSNPAWLDAMRKLRELDDNTVEDVRRLIDWLFTSEHPDAQFWARQIQSPANLRDEFMRLWGLMLAAQQPSPIRPGMHVESGTEMATRRARQAAEAQKASA